MNVMLLVENCSLAKVQVGGLLINSGKGEPIGRVFPKNAFSFSLASSWLVAILKRPP